MMVKKDFGPMLEDDPTTMGLLSAPTQVPQPQTPTEDVVETPPVLRISKKEKRDRRFVMLLEKTKYKKLKQLSDETGRSINDIINEAVDRIL